MTGGLTITVDARAAKGASDWFRAMRVRQLPFATAVAQTKTIRDAQRAIQGSAFSRFKLRRKTFPRHAIQMERANKSDFPNSKATVYVRPKYPMLELQEKGGTKRGKGGHRIAVPTRIVRMKGSGGPVALQRPKSIGARKGAEEIEGQLVHRTKRRRIGIFYTLTDSAKIRPKFRFEATGRKVIARVWAGHFKREYQNSLDPPTPRRR